jgi:hypothetical protein
MNEEISLNWQVSAMDCYPTFSGEKDYVFKVHWDCLSYYSGISGGPFYGKICTVQSLPANSGNFTPYPDLTESLVLSWVWDTMGTGSKYYYEQLAYLEIYNQLTPLVVQPPLPWSSGQMSI